MSVEGPRTAEQWFDTVLPASELQDLPDYRLYICTLMHGRPNDPEPVTAFPPMPGAGNESQGAVVVRTSLERYGRDRTLVEERITRFLSRS